MYNFAGSAINLYPLADFADRTVDDFIVYSTTQTIDFVSFLYIKFWGPIL